LLPPVGVRIPCPAGQVFKSAFAVGIEGAFRLPVALRCHPLTELVAVLRGVGPQDTGITVEVNVVQELTESLLPLCGAGVPCPAGHFLKSAFAVGLKPAVGMEVALVIDPMTELEAMESVGPWDASVTVAFDVAQELVETLLPLVSGDVPQRLGEIPATAEALVGILGQRGRHRLVEVSQIRAAIAELRNGCVEVLTDDGDGVRMLIRRRTSEQMKSGSGQGILIGAP